MFIECLLCARHCSWLWGNNSEQNRQKFLLLGKSHWRGRLEQERLKYRNSRVEKGSELMLEQVILIFTKWFITVDSGLDACPGLDTHLLALSSLATYLTSQASVSSSLHRYNDRAQEVKMF